MTTDARLAERWDAWSCGNAVSRLFGLADDLDRAYQRLAVTTTALADWRGPAAERARARMQAATLRVSGLAGLVRRAADAVRAGLPGMVPRTMCSTVSANLATSFGIRGLSYSISAACATSAHCIGAAADLIRLGRQDMVFAGGGEELHWAMAAQFDAMGALSTAYNETPAKAARPYDVGRDGFVIAGGGGMLVLEDYEHAKARGARIYAELVGYGVTSDGADMVAPTGEGAVRCMQMALADVSVPVDYLNTHGTATQAGDIVELEAVREVFGLEMPPLSSTKALTGHSLGAASVHEAIYSLLMLRDGFIAGSANIEQLDPRAEGYPIVRESRDAALATVMSNSFGFGGTNASLVFASV